MISMRLCLLLLLVMPLTGQGAEHKIFSYESEKFTYKLFVTRNIFSDKYEYICGIDSITIHDKFSGVSQTLKCETNGYNCRDTSKPVFSIEDMNFDGVEDIRIMQYLPAGPDIPYYYWLYDVKTKKFEPDKALEEITSPVFNHKTKSIKNEWRGSATMYGTSTYEYINGKLAKTEETTKDYDGQGFVTIIIKKRVKNKLVVTSRIKEKVE